MPKLILSEYVEAELDLIWEYIAIDNVGAADRFIEAAYACCQDLARMPGMGRKRRFSSERLRELRTFRVKGFENYLVFYSPISDGIEVFHIVHGARDLDQFGEAE